MSRTQWGAELTVPVDAERDHVEGPSDADVTLLEYGDLPDGKSVAGDMRLVVRNTAQLSADDRKAMAAYLKSLKGNPDAK